MTKYFKILFTLLKDHFLSWKGIGFSLNYFVNAWKYKKYSFFSSIYLSVRVEGKKFISIGRGTVIQRQGWILALKLDNTIPELSIGRNCAVGDFCHIAAIRSIIIEDNVLISNKVYISDNLHGYKDINTPVIGQPVVFKSEVLIGSGSWIGENVCIIGAKVGRNSVIGANSVVTNDIPDYSIAVGSPAKVIKHYDLELKDWVSI